MGKKKTGTYRRLLEIGLQDPFVRGIGGGAVVMAAAAAIAVSLLGSLTKAIIALALLLSFGIVFTILRTLMKYVDSGFVKMVCFTSCAVIMFVFVSFALLLIPAAVICWPQPYAQLLNLQSCSSVSIAPAVPVPTSLAMPKMFSPVRWVGKGIDFDADKNRFTILVFFRSERQEDAERIVGALRQAGYRSDGTASTLDEIFAPNKMPGTTLIKTTSTARPNADDVLKVVQYAIPLRASSVSVFPDDTSLRRGDMQVSLF